MKILYAIQGTGNGHVCRAREIVPLLLQHAEVDILISGIQSDIQLPFTVKYVYKGLSFIFGKKGGVDLLKTYKKAHLKQLLREIHSLPVEDYDMVISDFEPVSSWACKLKTKPCIALSHQSALLNKNSPRPHIKDPVGKAILKSYAPSSASYGFHFEAYDENIFTPVIRKEIREAKVSDDGHYTVYLPSYSDKRLIRLLSAFSNIRWHIFSKHFEHAIDSGNIKVSPLSNDAFIQDMASAHGVLCGAGFETPAEALFLKKKLLVIPMKNQYEQYCNGAALQKMGVRVINNIKKKNTGVINEWLADENIVDTEYPDQTSEIIQLLIKEHMSAGNGDLISDNEDKYNLKQFRKITLKRILYKISN